MANLRFAFVIAFQELKDSVVLGFPETVGDLKIVHTVLLHRFITKVDRKYTDINFLAKYF